MNPIQVLVEKAQAFGADFKIDGDRVTVVGSSPLPNDLLARLKEHRRELITYLSEKSPTLVGQSKMGLLAWASELVEHDIALANPVTFVEAPLRTITTEQVSRQASIYWRVITLARTNQRTGGWRPFTAEWWKDQEQKAFQALIALKDSIEEQNRNVENSHV